MINNILPHTQAKENPLLSAAINYAIKNQWPVIPLWWPTQDGNCACGNKNCTAPGKHPTISDWPSQGTTDPDKIAEWWAKWPTANVGILAGEKSGILLLDIDTKDDGPEILSGLELIYGTLPDTVEAITGSGGRHVLFRYPDGLKVPNKARFYDGLDTRSNGGMFVAPPSLHASGQNYSWDVLFHPDDIEMADCPEWLIKLMMAGNEKSNQVPKDPEPLISEGQRNNALTSLAGTMRRRGMSYPAILAALTEENNTRCQPPLDDREVETIARSVSRYSPEGDFAEKSDVTEQEWPEPEEIREELRPVEALPPAIIPAPFKPWLEDVSHRMQCPIDFVTIGALVSASAIIGAGCGIRPKERDDWTIIPNLWGGIIARPSMLKTPSLAEVMKPLSRLEVEAKEQFEEDLTYYDAEIEAFKAKKEALKSNMAAVAKGKKNAPFASMDELKDQLISLEEPGAPVRRRFKTNDSTIEKLAELLNENPRGLLLFRDELVGLLCSWDREDRKQDRAFYLEAWNGYGGFTSDRIGRGTVDVANCCVSLLGGIQPSKLTGYLQQATSDIANDGMIQRFQLLVYPDEPQNWELVDEWPNTEAKNRAWEILKRLADMNFIEAGAELPEGERIHHFRFSQSGQAVFNEWLTELEIKLRVDDMPVMTEHLAKYRSLMPSLALIFHLMEIADGKASGPVTQECAEMAAAWCEYLESHARRIYGLLGDVSVKAAAELAKKIQAGKVQNGFSMRDVYQNGWHMLDTREKVESACCELIDSGWLKKDAVDVPGRQRAKEIFRINPKIFS